MDLITTILILVGTAAFVTGVLVLPSKWLSSMAIQRYGRLYISGPLMLTCSTVCLAFVFFALSGGASDVAMIVFGVITASGLIGVALNFTLRRDVYPEMTYVIVTELIFGLATGISFVASILN